MEFIGLIPAGGTAKRLAPLPCSKELFPVGFLEGKDGVPRPKVACRYLLEGLKEAGVKKSYIILRPGKWDIPAYLGSGKDLGLHLGYLILDFRYGAPFTLDAAYPFAKESMVVFGYPDILYKPRDAFKQLLDRWKKTRADVVLGLFKADKPQKVDMVQLGEKGSLERIDIKPLESDLVYSWLMAVWTPFFTKFLHHYVAKFLKSPGRGDAAGIGADEKESYVGEVFQAAMNAGISIDTLKIEQGEYIDIGTPDDLYASMKSEVPLGQHRMEEFK